VTEILLSFWEVW